MTSPETTVGVSVTVNGEPTSARVPARTLLSAYVREVASLTGTHRGCETAKCGACTVLLDGEAVKSCNVLAAQADGREVVTAEGLAEGGELSPVQRAFWDCHGTQCGYCTPGFVVAATALLDDNPDPSVEEIRHGLAGNLCRCTGYVNIIESVQQAARARAENGGEQR